MPAHLEIHLGDGLATPKQATALGTGPSFEAITPALKKPHCLSREVRRLAAGQHPDAYAVIGPSLVTRSPSYRQVQ